MLRISFLVLLASLWTGRAFAQPPADAGVPALPVPEQLTPDATPLPEPQEPVAPAPALPEASDAPPPPVPTAIEEAETTHLEQTPVEEPSTEPATPPPVTRIELGELTLRLDGEVRGRLEVRTGRFVFSPAGTRRGSATAFVESRARLGLSAEWRALRVYAQLQDARSWGSVQPAELSGASTDFHQAFFEVRGEHLWARVGRQEYVLGAERFIGPLAWTAAARSFDGVRLHGQWGVFEPDFFVSWTRAQQSVTSETGANLGASEGDFLGVLALTTRLEQLTVEPYLIYRHEGPSNANPQRQSDLAHIGVRVNGVLGDFDYDFEGAVQGGYARRDRFSDLLTAGQNSATFAGTASIDAGYKLGGPIGAYVSVGASYGSGQSSDGAVDELENFFPTNHLFYGYADVHGLRNTIDARLRLRSSPTGTPFKIWLDAHLLALAVPGARWSNAGGATLGQNSANDSRITGGEIDLEFRWNPIDQLAISGGYALFIPGPAAKALSAVDESSAGVPMHWFYLMTGVILP